jgi:hypothetical protein
MSERPSMSWSRVSTASKILLIAGVLYFIDLFLAWQKACFLNICGTASGWHGWGIVNGILVIIIIVMEVLVLANVDVNTGTPEMRFKVEAGLAWGVLLFTIIKFFVDNEARSWPAWVGLILAVIIGYGGWMRWQEASVTTPPPTPGGGYAS